MELKHRITASFSHLCHEWSVQDWGKRGLVTSTPAVNFLDMAGVKLAFKWS
jgi:hypothetical protein